MTRAGRRGFLIALLALPAGGVVTPMAAQPHRIAAEQALAGLERAAGAPVSATFSPVTEVVTFLSIPADAPVRVQLPAAETPERRARAFLGTWGGAFGVGDGRELALEKATPPDDVGMEHVRFQQTHRGVPVTGGELTVHLRGNGVVAVNAKTVPGLDGIDVRPAKTAAAAHAATRALLETEFGVTGAQLSDPRLELLNAGLFEGRQSETRLAWFTEATKTDLREFIWIDAESGKLLLRFSQLTDALVRLIFDANDPGDAVFDDLPGDLVRLEGEGPTGDADADAAYDYSGDTYDYFWEEHGRDSFNDSGTWLVSSVHFCPSALSSDCPYQNAFWNGQQMVYGDGYPAADDVVAHELTHAVTEYTARLFYYMQSGALNESYSDIFGEAVDLSNASGTDTSGTRWQMGEDVPGSGAIRDMMDPTLFGDPGKMSDTQFVCQAPGGDGGGVHTNSGVPNHAFALMVDGGSYNGVNILYGLGLEKAARIQYRALSYYLTSASNFRDNYDALLQSCYDLTPASPFTPSFDCFVVKQALDAVEMSEGWPCTSPLPEVTVPELCPDAQSPSIRHYWDIETSGLPDCPSDDVMDPVAWCVNGPASFLGAHATSGDKSYWGYTPSTVSNFAVRVPTGITLPTGARMQFNHSHGFDNFGSTYYDGGWIEYTTTGGAPFLDAGSLISAGQTYGGTISASGDNPRAGMSAFVGDSWGFTASQLDLSTLAGEQFDYVFRAATDSSYWDYGWFIDDIRIYTCATCEKTRVLDSGYNGVDDEYRASISIRAGAGYTVSEMDSVVLSAPTVRFDNGFEVRGEMTVDDSACIYLPSL